jgi:tetratricopeptide (TPR) repeat protein
MPYGKKIANMKSFPFGLVLPQEIDFDYIYDEIFKPAIGDVHLSDGEHLEPKRADRSFESNLIMVEMTLSVECSRFVLADITGLNPNVFFELGHRYRACKSGTAIFKQPHVETPFDINSVRVFDYEYETKNQVEQSRSLVTKVIETSLKQMSLDSPIYQAIKSLQSADPELIDLLLKATNAMRSGKTEEAIKYMEDAVKRFPENGLLHLRLGILYQDKQDYDKALNEINQAINILADYSAAYREKGITEYLRYRAAGMPELMTTGEESLIHAMQLDPDDFQAPLVRARINQDQGQFLKAAEMIEKAVQIYPDNPDLLVNNFVIKTGLAKNIVIDQQTSFQIKNTTQFLEAQLEVKPKVQIPSYYFDLAQINLIEGKKTKFLTLLNQGAKRAEPLNMLGVHNNLKLLHESGVELRGLEEGMALLDSKIGKFRF